MTEKCIKCGKELDVFDVGLTKKLVNRGSTEFMCKACLAREFDVTIEQLDAQIVKFQRSGCTLFPPLEK